MTGPERVVGIGSSAGGLEALTHVLAQIPKDIPFCFIVAQHMAPTTDSPLVGLLARATSLTVRPSQDGDELSPGTVFVAPPDADVLVDEHCVRLQPPSATGPHPKIDTLLESIAQHHGQRGVALILSGSGSDGAEGARRVHDVGGAVLVQSPSSAQFASMPQACIDTGCADLVIDADEFASILQRLPALAAASSETAHAVIGGPLDAGAHHDDSDHLQAILDVLRRSSGVDFSGYKRGTLQRQIARRIALTGAPDMAKYREAVVEDEQEARSLQDALLVSVTGFFRDPDSWEALARCLHDAWASDGDQQRRIWVPGCSSGEEAYTVAMIAAEALGSPTNLQERVKVFATDLREDVLATGRKGLYSAAAVEAIPERMRTRWWRQQANGWEAVPPLRDAVVFARHNVTSDPPFPRIDLISVRNTLIYFQGSLQNRALRMFRYSLSSGGVLFLGRAERIDESNTYFRPVNQTHRIYERTDAESVDALPAVFDADETSASVRKPPQDRIKDSMLVHLLPPALVVDGNDDVVEVVGDVGPWCWVAPGTPSTNLVALLREELRVKVRTLVLRARHGGSPSVDAVALVDSEPVLISVRTLGDEHPGYAAITFQTSPEPPSVEHASPTADVLEVTRELESTQAALQSTVEDLSASNEELRALNEELQASSEEAQSANEELQATNEELSTLNQEMQIRTSDLEQANADLNNIQTSISAGIILVDRDLKVTRFTPSAVRVFALINDDLGRELVSIPTTIPIKDLEVALRETIHHGQQRTFDISGQGSDFILQIRPYMSDDGRVLGAVLVLTDVSTVAEARREVAQALAQLNAATDAIDDVVWQRDEGGQLVLISRGVTQVFGLKRERVLADPGLLMAAIHPDDRERVSLAMSAAQGAWSVRYRIVRPDGAVRWVQDDASPTPAGRLDGFTSGCIRDITERVAGEDLGKEVLGLQNAIFDLKYVGLAIVDGSGRIVRANPALCGLSGYEAADLLGMPLSAIINAFRDPSTVGEDTSVHRLLMKDQTPRWVTLQIKALTPEADRPDDGTLLATIIEATPSMGLAESSESQIRFDPQTGVLARAAFRRRVEAELNRCQRDSCELAVLWIDLDRFKEVNDTYGHRTGDFVLNALAQRITALGLRSDNIGRLGGDEFGILVSEPDDLDLICQRVLASIREPLISADSTLFISASIGVAIGLADGDNADLLLHNADTAMYSAKQHGGDRSVYFQKSMNDLAKARGVHRQNLAAAIRARSFRMHYQPIVDLATGQAKAAEGLIRWVEADKVWSAGSFIEDAQATGLMRSIGRIGRSLVDTDLQAMQESAAVDGLLISINLAVEELEDRELMQWVLRWTPPGGMSRILVEVTEQSLLAGAGIAMDTLLVFQRLGAQICIDDFGTGYSNIAILTRLRPSIIKMDMSLLLGAVEDIRGRRLLGASIQMAHALQATVVVEGIETVEHANLARELGAELGQGYLYAKPMPLTDLMAWIANQEPSPSGVTQP